MNLKVKKVRDGAKLPERATQGAAAADLCAVCEPEGITLAPMERALIPTGIAIELPNENYVALVFARSGLGIKKGIGLSNGVGVIDSDYRGEVQVGLINMGSEPYTIQNGERIAQLAVLPILPFEIEVCDELSETTRGESGFGSTGRQ